jgi:hypothetical protein
MGAVVMERTEFRSLLGSSILRGQEDVPAALQTTLSVARVYSNVFEDQCVGLTPVSTQKLGKKIIFRSVLPNHAQLKVTPLWNSKAGDTSSSRDVRIVCPRLKR